MTDNEILKRIKKYFDIKELVGEYAWKLHGDSAWKFLDIRLLHALLIVREGIGKQIFCNNWDIGGEFDERGLRDNTQDILQKKTRSNILYLSAHILGKAADFDVEGMTAEDVRQWIIGHGDLFPFELRLEKGVNWTHLDVIQEGKGKVYLF